MTRRLIYDSVVDKARLNKRLREEGKHVCIPFPFPGLSKIHPGIEQGTYYLVSGNQKAGKTQIADYLFLYNAFKFVTERETNIKLKVFSFNLEMDKQSKIRQAIVHRLFLKKGIVLSTRDLNSLFDDRVLPDHILRFVEEDREWFDRFESIVEFVDDIRNPFGIYDHVRNYFESNGSYTYKTIFVRDDKGIFKDKQIIDTYTPNDPDLYVLIMVDNVNLMLTEKGGTLYDAISDFSSNYMVRARNRWGAIPVIIQQQALGQESANNRKMEMTEPSATGLADNKVTSKDCNALITIYDPVRNKNNNYLKYAVDKMGGRYRRLAIELDRHGINCETSLYFNGAVNFYKELPAASAMTTDMYDRISKDLIRQ